MSCSINDYFKKIITTSTFELHYLKVEQNNDSFKIILLNDYTLLENEMKIILFYMHYKYSMKLCLSLILLYYNQSNAAFSLLQMDGLYYYYHLKCFWIKLIIF